MANTTTIQPVAETTPTSVLESTTTDSMPTRFFTASSSSVGPETILPVILVAIAIVIALIFAFVIFRRRQIRRKKMYATQLALTNRRIKAIDMLKQKAENELASWPHAPSQIQGQTTAAHGGATVHKSMISSSISSLQSEPAVYGQKTSHNVQPSRCHSANAIIVPATTEAHRVYTLELLASRRNMPPRRNSASDLSAPSNNVMRRGVPSKFGSQRVSDRPHSKVAVVEVHERRGSRSMSGTWQDGEVRSASHTATHGSTSVQAESSNVDSYYPSSAYDSPGWASIDRAKVRRVVREQWTGTPLASEASTEVTEPPSQVTSQSEKWV